MANSYSQIYIQIVFAVKGRNNLINPAWEERLYQYITGVIRKDGHKLLAINGMPDHIHIFIGYKPESSLSSLVKEIKLASNTFINDNKLTTQKFYWQEGFGAFSYSHSQIDRVVKYVLNQKEHHRKKSFRDEYLDLLKKYDITYNEKYLFEWIE